MKPITIDTLRFKDDRGFTSVIYDKQLQQEYGFTFNIKQINQGYSLKKNTLRGMHYQEKQHAQAKYVTVLKGSILNVVVNIDKGSKDYKKVYSEVLSFENGKAVYIPKGYAHGYLVLEDDTYMQWCVDEDFNSSSAKCILYSSIDFNWNEEEFILSDKDKQGIDINCL